MGEVYRAKDTKLGRDVALKVLTEEFFQDQGRVARFEREARSLAALNHPNIAVIHSFEEIAGRHVLVMELVEGNTLRLAFPAELLPAKRLLEIGVQIAEGLAKAHAAGIVHRDLKPENVIVSRDGWVKILDFGLAKLAEPTSQGLSGMATASGTVPGMVMGTVGYMSPEQASGKPADFRADQFSFGTILYELATGQRAFQRDSTAETLVAVIREEPEPIAKLNPRLPAPRPFRPRRSRRTRPPTGGRGAWRGPAPGRAWRHSGRPRPSRDSVPRSSAAAPAGAGSVSRSARALRG